MRTEQKTQGFCWVDTHMAALVAVSEGSLSSGEVVAVKAQTGVLPLSPLLSLTLPPQSPQYFSFVAL